MRRAVAVLLTAVMAVAMFAGCSMTKGASAGSKNSMFGIVKSVGHLENYTVVCEATLDISGTNVTIKMNGETDGNATVMSLEASTGGMTFKFDNVFVYTEDALYINVAEVADEVGVLLSAFTGVSGPIDLSEYGLTSDWVSIEAKGMFKKDMTLIDVFCDDLDEAYADIIKKNDGTYSITISDKDSVKALMDATYDLLDKNGDKWAKLMDEQVKEKDVQSVVNGIVNDLMDSIVKAYEEATGEKLSEEDIEDMKEEILSYANVSDMDEINADAYKEMFEELKNSIKDAEAEGIDGTMDVRVSYEKGVYTLKAKAEASDESEGDMTIVTTIEEGKAGKVEVPSDAQSFVDVIVPLLISAELGTQDDLW